MPSDSQRIQSLFLHYYANTQCAFAIASLCAQLEPMFCISGDTNKAELNVNSSGVNSIVHGVCITVGKIDSWYLTLVFIMVTYECANGCKLYTYTSFYALYLATKY